MTIRVAFSLPRMEFINNCDLASVGDGGVGGMLLWTDNRVTVSKLYQTYCLGDGLLYVSEVLNMSMFLSY